MTKRARRLLPYDAVPFTNNGYTIQPGEAAIAVTTCTRKFSLRVSRGCLRVGRYLGTRGGNVVMEVHDKRTLLVDANDVPYDWVAERRECPPPWGTSPRPNYSLRWGTPEWHAEQARYKAEYQTWLDTVYKDHQEKVAARKVGYSDKEFPYTWVTQLQNNNIYPAGIALVDVTL